MWRFCIGEGGDVVFEGLISFSFCFGIFIFSFCFFFLANHRRMNFTFSISHFAF